MITGTGELQLKCESLISVHGCKRIDVLLYLEWKVFVYQKGRFDFLTENKRNNSRELIPGHPLLIQGHPPLRPLPSGAVYITEGNLIISHHILPRFSTTSQANYLFYLRAI